MYRIIVKGVVQGVGFRPFIYRLAQELGLKGFVRNTLKGVEIVIDREPQRFVELLLSRKPPISEIFETQISEVSDIAPEDFDGFKILPSDAGGFKNILLTPDIAICDKCLQELNDPKDRRYRYPFINCTDCGPRFSIIRDLPYDRKNTSMRDFVMCPECAAEYSDIGTRRFHAQPNCCEVCGPHYFLVDNEGHDLSEGEEAFAQTVSLLRDGKIIAFKGLGGFHLLCDPTKAEAVELLRQRKNRPRKPFALMMRDIETVKQFCAVTPEEERILKSPQHPIVLLRKKDLDSDFGELIAPKNNYLGVMLPYTPAHVLLMQEIPVLIATSGNREGWPLEHKNNDALVNLRDIADYFMLHNREIVNRIDDSICFYSPYFGEILVRRARGYTPMPILRPVDMGGCDAPVLGVGAEENSTFCIAKGKYLFLSQYQGDLNEYKCVDFYRRNLKQFFFYFDFKPQCIARDLHPDYASTQIALDFTAAEDMEEYRIQHHYAHYIATAVSNGLSAEEKNLGVVWDGTGLGLDGKIWGSEFLVADFHHFKRVAHLRYIPLFGGAKAIKEPWLIALGLLYESGLVEEAEKLWPDRNLDFYMKFFKAKTNIVYSAGMGRLFDGIAALLGVCDIATFDAEAAIGLQMLAERVVLVKRAQQGKHLQYNITQRDDIYEIDWRPMIKDIMQSLKQGISPEILAFAFHRALVEILKKLAKSLKKQYNFQKIVLGGGCWQNQLLLKLAAEELSPEFQLIMPKAVPPNDQSISLGQVSYVLSNSNANCRDRR